jgi:DNA-binding transcriptional LysR family regulator
MIEFYLLEQLDAFHRCGTLSAAAEELHLAQPSLSRSMQKLETLLGVTLFERQKNRLKLNKTGILAAEYAARIVENVNEMEQRIQLFDKSLHTLTIGSCAPGPLIKILPRITPVFSEQALISTMETETILLQGLRTSAYQLIIVSHPIKDDDLICQEYITEHLYMSVNNFHPAVTYSSITFEQADGQNFIMYAKVGIWEQIIRKKMPHARFFKQEDLDAVGELAGNSDLPMFSTNITMKEIPSRKKNRVNIPFSDDEASVTFYLVYAKKDAPRFRQLIHILNEI